MTKNNDNEPHYIPDADVRDLYLRAKSKGDYLPFVKAAIGNAVYLGSNADKDGDGQVSIEEAHRLIDHAADTAGLNKEKFCEAIGDPDKSKLRLDFGHALQEGLKQPQAPGAARAVADGLAAIVNDEAGGGAFILGTSGGTLEAPVREALADPAIRQAASRLVTGYDFEPRLMCEGDALAPNTGGAKKPPRAKS